MSPRLVNRKSAGSGAKRRPDGKGGSGRSGKQVRWIADPRQLKALSTPIRHDIVDRLTALGPLPVKELADVLGRKPTAIYRHLITLEKLGLVAASRVSGARGRPAMIYCAAAPRMRIARAPRVKGNRGPMAKIASAMARQAARKYTAAFRSNDWIVEGAKRNHGFVALVSAPSNKRLAKINALLDELTHLIWTPDPKPGKRIRVTWFMSPSHGARGTETR
jgi:DNA-binding transcriptional ArsR family regulator